MTAPSWVRMICRPAEARMAGIALINTASNSAMSRITVFQLLPRRQIWRFLPFGILFIGQRPAIGGAFTVPAFVLGGGKQFNFRVSEVKSLASESRNGARALPTLGRWTGR
jgi:hypothetical protein